VARPGAVRKALALPADSGDPGPSFGPGGGAARTGTAAAGLATAEFPATGESPGGPPPEDGVPEDGVPDDGVPDDAPADRARKPLLVAAAAVGVLVLGVPLLLVVRAAGSNGNGDHHATAGTAGHARTRIDEDGFASRAPSASASASAHAAEHKHAASHAATKGKAAKSRSGDALTPLDPAGSPASAPAAATSKRGSGTAQKAAARSGPSTAATSAAKAEAKAKGTVMVSFGGVSDVLLKNADTGLCVDVPGTGKGSTAGILDQNACIPGTGDNQMWDLDVTAPGAGPSGANLFAIRNRKDGYCMDLPGQGADSDGGRVFENKCYTTVNDNQLWWLEERSGGTYWIRNYASDQLCLSVNGHRSTSVARIVLGTCSDSDDENWTFGS
jgi:hypothetical protein